MLVTAAVFQSAIGPYVVCAALGLVTHAVTAVPRFASLMTVSEAVGAGVGAGVGEGVGAGVGLNANTKPLTRQCALCQELASPRIDPRTSASARESKESSTTGRPFAASTPSCHTRCA